MIRWLFVLCLAACAGLSSAHELSMAEMTVREVTPGEFYWQWTAGDRAQPADELKPRWPDGCRAEDTLVRCGAGGLKGELGIEGIGKRFSAAMVKIAWLDGGSRVYTLTSAQTAVRLHGGAEDRRDRLEVASAYGVLGIEHILTGWDHLLFVIALLCLVGFGRPLVATVTAFTVAHSITLALGAFGLLTLRPPPVEATIALSIVLVAREAMHEGATLARRWPALVAFGFGLLHGLGFAGALKEFGLPDSHVAIALLTFNLGVEAGQLLVVGLAWGLHRGLAGWRGAARSRTAALYAIGSLAAYWSLVRVVAMFR
ncbi:MAG: HupE/UreJ family protein [Burkholderiales bacterium]